jgi:hypothetical protein
MEQELPSLPGAVFNLTPLFDSLIRSSAFGMDSSRPHTEAAGPNSQPRSQRRSPCWPSFASTCASPIGRRIPVESGRRERVVTSCLHFVSTCIHFSENRRAETPCQAQKIVCGQFMGPANVLVECALRRHVESSGGTPDRRCSSQPEALGAVQEVTIGLKHSKRRLR